MLETLTPPPPIQLTIVRTLDADAQTDTHRYPEHRRQRTALAVLALLGVTALYLKYGPRWTTIALVPWTCGLLALAATDVRQHRLPTATIHLTAAVTAAALTLTAAATDNWTRLIVAILCATAAAVVYGALWLASPRSLGYGDVRLAALAALMLGWLSPELAIIGLVAGQLACLASAATLTAAKRINRHTELPLGTFLAIASIATAIALGR